MKRAWTKGWIAAAIALAAILILAIDVAQKQSRPVAHTGTKTVAAAQAAGASGCAKFPLCANTGHSRTDKLSVKSYQ
jgi:hypothetical protein